MRMIPEPIIGKKVVWGDDSDDLGTIINIGFIKDNIFFLVRWDEVQTGNNLQEDWYTYSQLRFI